jgi:hypothetical protein
MTEAMRPIHFGMMLVVWWCACSSHRYAEASCGDHLAMSRHSSKDRLTTSDQVPVDRPAPCRGPLCQMVPDHSVPTPAPTATIIMRESLMQLRQSVIVQTELAGDRVPSDQFAVQPEVCSRLERPPECC